MSVIAFVHAIWPTVCLTSISNAITPFLLMWLLVPMYTARPRPLRQAAVALTMGFVQTLPIFVAHYFTFPDSLKMTTHTLLLFPSPLFLLLFYLMLRFYLRIPQSRCAPIAKRVACYANVPLCAFLWAQQMLLLHYNGTDLVRDVDYHAMLIGTVSVALLCCLAAAVVRAKHLRINLPASGSGQKHSLLWAFVEITLIYGSLVLFRLSFGGPSVPTPYDVRSEHAHFVSYAMLLVMWVVYFILDIYRDMLKARSYELVNLKAHILLLNESNEQMRGFRHDIRNMMQVYDGYLKTQDLSGLSAYHSSVFQLAQQADSNVELSEALAHHPGVHALLLAKDIYALELSVGLTLNPGDVLPLLALGELALCRILGVLLDNAIEAAAASERKSVHVSIRQRDDQALFIVDNTNDERIDLARVFDLGYSTKGEGRGFGLYELNHLVKASGVCTLSPIQYEDLVSFYFSVSYA